MAAPAERDVQPILPRDGEGMRNVVGSATTHDRARANTVKANGGPTSYSLEAANRMAPIPAARAVSRCLEEGVECGGTKAMPAAIPAPLV